MIAAGRASIRPAILLLLAVIGSASGAAAQDERPPFRDNRAEEDWRFLSDPAKRTERLDALKHIELDADGRTYLYLGGSLRTQTETYSNENWGANPGSDTSWHRRVMVHAGLVVNERLRLFGELKHAGVEGRRFALPASELDRLDWNQAFVELRGGDGSNTLIRVGRQELDYGAGRLVTVRDGVNVRRSFDGALVRTGAGGWTADAFLVQTVGDGKGAFDNERLSGTRLAGLYLSSPAGPRDRFEIYGFADERPIDALLGRPGEEARYTLGGRWIFNQGAWSGDAEAAFQTGEQSLADGTSRDIAAWTLAGRIQRAFRDAPLNPVLALEVGVASGDGNPADSRVGTFRAPYPPGRYFGRSNPLGPGNIAGYGLSATFQPIPKLTVTPQLRGFWRTSDEDGIYSPPGSSLRPTPAGGARHIGDEAALAIGYAFDRHLRLDAAVAYFRAGEFLKANPPSKDIGYVEVRLGYQF